MREIQTPHIPHYLSAQNAPIVPSELLFNSYLNSQFQLPPTINRSNKTLIRPLTTQLIQQSPIKTNMPTQAQMNHRTRASKKATGGRTRKPPSRNPKPPPPPPRNPKPPPIARSLKRKQPPPKNRAAIPKGIPAAVYPGRFKMAPFPCPMLLPTYQINMTDQPTQPTTDITSREILLQTHQPIPTIISSPTSKLMPPPSHLSDLRIRIKNQAKISILHADPSPSSPISQSEVTLPCPSTQLSIRKTRSKASQEDAELLTLLDELKSHESKNPCKTDAIYASN